MRGRRPDRRRCGSQGKTAFRHLEDASGPDPGLLPTRRARRAAGRWSSCSTSTTTSASRGALFRTKNGRGHRPGRRADAARRSRSGRCRAARRRWATRARSPTAACTDPEVRYRQRYADLAVHPEVRAVFRLRARAIALDAALPRRAGLPRGGDADPAAALRRSRGPAVRDAPQRAGHAALPPDRGRAVPQAAAGRRARAGVRDRARLPERGDGPHAQSRVHHARGVPGVRRLRRHDGAWSRAW